MTNEGQELLFAAVSALFHCLPPKHSFTLTAMLIMKFVLQKTLSGKVLSFSRRKLSIFCRPFSSTDAQMDQMRLKVNQSSTIGPRFSLSDDFTLNRRKKAT